jgi:uncharacterized membrane protein
MLDIGKESRSQEKGLRGSLGRQRESPHRSSHATRPIASLQSQHKNLQLHLNYQPSTSFILTFTAQKSLYLFGVIIMASNLYPQGITLHSLGYAALKYPNLPPELPVPLNNQLGVLARSPLSTQIRIMAQVSQAIVVTFTLSYFVSRALDLSILKHEFA